MARLAGDPGPGAKLKYTAGLRLPAENRDWVRHDLTDADWRWRLIGRQLAVLTPLAALLALVPGPVEFRLLGPLLVWLIGGFIVVAYVDEVRDRKLRQHGFTPPPRDRGPA